MLGMLVIKYFNKYICILKSKNLESYYNLIIIYNFNWLSVYIVICIEYCLNVLFFNSLLDMMIYF